MFRQYSTIVAESLKYQAEAEIGLLKGEKEDTGILKRDIALGAMLALLSFGTLALEVESTSSLSRGTMLSPDKTVNTLLGNTKGIARAPLYVLSGPPLLEWNRTYGGIGGEAAYSVIQTSDGGYALAGGRSNDLWLVKTNALGSMQWNKTYGGEFVDQAYDVVQTTDGGYAIAGETSPGVGGSLDFCLVKTDGLGNMQWNMAYGGSGTEEVRSVLQTGDGGYVLTGYTDSFGAGSQDMWLVKTDGLGSMQWNKTYGGGNVDRAHSVVQTSDGGYALAGVTDVYPDWGGRQYFLVKTDGLGNMQWSQTYGGIYYDIALSVVQTNDGGYALAGIYAFDAPIDSQFWLVKTNSMGGVLWDQGYGGANDEEAWSVIQTTDGGYLIAGNTRSYGAGGSDFWLVKTDASASVQWSQTYGGTNDDEAYSVVQTLDGGYAVAGFTDSFGAGGSDFWFIKIEGEDTDSDGLLDSWELNGIDLDRDGTVDLNLPALGVNWRHKDLLIEIDYMGLNATTGPTHDHNPDPSAINDVISAFSNSPVSNPDSIDGIKLRIDVDEEIPHQDVINLWGDFDITKNSRFGTPTQRSNPNSANILAAERLVYHYVLFIHQYALWDGAQWVTDTATGRAELPGNDFIVSLGAWTNSRGSRDEQAGTLMHEFGHNLNLRHGGADDINGKPNYLSIMSWSRQLRDLIPNRRLDYSRSELPTLSENSLNEGVGISGPVGELTVFGVIDPVTGNLNQVIAPSSGPIDWNGDGDTLDTGVSRNINTFTGFEDSSFGLLRGYNDWLNLLYSFRGTPEFADGVHLNVADQEITWETVENMRSAITLQHITICGYCISQNVDVPVSITMDGSPTGFSTPHSWFLNETHTFTVPNADPHGHPFLNWNTGSASTTIAVSAVGTYTAYYQTASSVGGVRIPIDKIGLLAPYIGLASTILVATVATAIYAKRVKHRKERQ